MVEKGLAAIASMVRSAPDRKERWAIVFFTESLCDHMN